MSTEANSYVSMAALSRKAPALCKKAKSKLMFCPKMGALPIKSINSGSASCNIGAFWTILLEMPVRLLMNWGMGLRGLMSVENSESMRFWLNFTAPISITESRLGSRPVVSRSSETITGMGKIIPQGVYKPPQKLIRESWCL